MCSLPHGGSCASLFYHTYINILCNKIHLETSQGKCRCRITVTVRLWWILTCGRWEMPVEGSTLLENVPRWRATHCPCILYCPCYVILSCGQVAELHLAKALCHCATAESSRARPFVYKPWACWPMWEATSLCMIHCTPSLKVNTHHQNSVLRVCRLHPASNGNSISKSHPECMCVGGGGGGRSHCKCKNILLQSPGGGGGEKRSLLTKNILPQSSVRARAMGQN